ncbi:MAG: hypothetical protein JXP73_06470 [Deltaproteobacteria bacterium]|nr:hypothetical protein [Deltaproteobacteria bacterium]
MKTAPGFWLLIVTATAACSVDVSRLTTTAGQRPDAAADVAPDRGPGSDDRPSPVADAPGLGPETVAEMVDADTPADGSDAVAPDGNDATDAVDESDTVAPPDRDAAAMPDLPQTSPDLPQASLDLPQSSPDLPQASLDIASLDVDASLSDDTNPAASDTATSADLAPSLDLATDTRKRSNGSPCNTAEECESGFCVGPPGRCCNQSCTSVCYRAGECPTGTCVPARGTITCGDLDALCGLVVNDPTNARDWSFQTDLQVGKQALGSDPYQLTAVPSELAGSPWIRPSRLSKSAAANPLVRFTISASADVYVGVDVRVSPPWWMADWTDTGLSLAYLSTSDYEPPSTVTQRLLKTRFAAGEVTLGPMGCISTSDCSMYLTVIRFADQVGATAPVCTRH